MPLGWDGGEQAVVNIIGHAAGILIFGIFLFLIVRQRSGTRLRFSWQPLTAASLALLWNSASLGVLLIGRFAAGSVTPDHGGALATRVLAAIAFSSLSVLPAVLFQLCLMGRFPQLCWMGYILSTIAVIAHLLELLTHALDFHRLGLSIITMGFGALTSIAIALSLWSESPPEPTLTSRTFATMSLFLLAVSFAHFSDGHITRAWSSELAFHHAGIPLALFVLMQEFRFVLVDAFIRFLANGLLAGCFGLAISLWSPGHELALRALAAALLVAMFAISREVLQSVLTRVVFRQPNRATIERVAQALKIQRGNEEAYLEYAAAQITDVMSATLVAIDPKLLLSGILTSASPVEDLPDFKHLQRRGVRVVIPLRLASGDTSYLLLGPRRGGRPYLSEDLKVLTRLSGLVVEQVEQIRAAETQRLAAQAELSALQAQIHPHFLFNAFNTLYGIIPRELVTARRTVLNLVDIFRYFLRSDKGFVSVEEEIKIVKAALAIESQRLGDKLEISIDIDQSLLNESLPTLTIQPLVENAIKHGIARRTDGGAIGICIVREANGMRVSISDTGPGFECADSVAVAGMGVGLNNVRRRLQLCYGPQARVVIQSTPRGSTVSFYAPCRQRELMETAIGEKANGGSPQPG